MIINMNVDKSMKRKIVAPVNFILNFSIHKIFIWTPIFDEIKTN